MWKYAIMALVSAVTIGVVGCSSDDGDGDGAEATGGSGNVGGISLGGGNGGTGGGIGGSAAGISFTPGPNGECTLSDQGQGCTGASYVPEIVPLDIYIMFDQTGSTCACIDPPQQGTPGTCPPQNCNMTRLEAIRQAATQFVQDPESAGIGVGIGYFGDLEIGSASCNPADYADAEVGIADLPGNAQNIIASLNTKQPTGETASGAAIRGACTYASQWKATHPGRETVILLLTDGRPEAPVTCANGTGPCCPTLPDTVAAATECRNGDPTVRTYVLGVGPFLQNLEEIAVAGGTDQAYLVEDAGGSEQILAALRQIRGNAIIPCDLGIPDPPAGEEINPLEVNIGYANAECEGSLIYHVNDVASCTNTGGWYYDDPFNPQTVHLCPTSCDQVKDPGGSLLFSVGCGTIDIPE
jgi:hypothetical protein